MAGDKRILIDLLLETSRTPIDPTHLHATSERLRSALLLNSSNSPRACTLVDGVAYGSTATRQGLAVGDALLSDVFDTLSRHDLPAALAEKEPELTPEDWHAAMRVVAHVLRAFERTASTRDEH